MNRVDWLKALLNFDRPLEEVTSGLVSFPWDSLEELAILNSDHFIEVLRRYLVGEVGSEQVETWANAIEGREDIGFDQDNRDLVREVLHELANPYLTRALSFEVARDWIERLSHPPVR